jgi:hypothetical protein
MNKDMRGSVSSEVLARGLREQAAKAADAVLTSAFRDVEIESGFEKFCLVASAQAQT